MNSKDIKRLHILDALFKEKQLTIKEMQYLELSHKYTTDDEFLWQIKKINGYKLYELSQHGYEVYKYLKQKRLKEIIIRVLIVIIGAIIIYYLDTKT